MELEEYKQRASELQQEYKRKLRTLQTEYAISNNHCNVGDILTDHYQIIKYESHKIVKSYHSELPIMLFIGPLLKKNGQPRKDGKKGEVYQPNLKKINGVEV